MTNLNKTNDSKWTKIDGYNFLGINPNIRKGRVTVIGTWLLPLDVISYIVISDRIETLSRLNVTMEEIDECMAWISEKIEKIQLP